MTQQLDHADEIVRLLAVQIRKDFETQDEAIIALNKAGFGPARIGELLGTTSNTANQSIQRAKRKAAKGSSTKKTGAKAQKAGGSR